MLSGAPEILSDQQAHTGPCHARQPAASSTLPGKRLLPAGVCQRAFVAHFSSPALVVTARRPDSLAGPAQE